MDDNKGVRVITKVTIFETWDGDHEAVGVAYGNKFGLVATKYELTKPMERKDAEKVYQKCIDLAVGKRRLSAVYSGEPLYG